MPDAKDYTELAKKLLSEAQKGNSQAQYHLGVLFNDGKGVTKDYKQAASWYLKAANQGHQKAQLYLGLLFLNGRGVAKDYSQAAQWFTKSAEQGEQKSQYYLGLLYYNGAGVAKDLEHAAHWLELSANQGNAQAQKLLDEILSITAPEPEDIDPYDETSGKFDDAENNSSSGGGWGTILGALILIVLVIGAAGGGYYYFFMRKPAPVSNLRAQDVHSRSGGHNATADNMRASSPQQLQGELAGAVRKGDVNTILDLLRHNADPNFTDEKQVSLLQSVIMADDEIISRTDKRRIVSDMIRNGADVNYHGGSNSSGECTCTALSLAVQNDDPETAGVLLDAGADPDIKDDNGYTALDYANMLRNSSAMKKSDVYRRMQSGNRSSAAQKNAVRSDTSQNTTVKVNYSTEEDTSEEDTSQNVRVKAEISQEDSLQEQSAGTSGQEQLEKLVSEGKIPDYVMSKGKFSYNSKYSMVRVTGTGVRLRSQPNTQSKIIDTSDKGEWGSIVYWGEWVHPNGEKWIVGLYDDWNSYPEKTPEEDKKVVWVSAKFAKPVTEDEYWRWQDTIEREDD